MEQIYIIQGYGKDVLEKDIEDALVSNITDLLLEFGNGFAFVGRQYHLEIELLFKCSRYVIEKRR